MEASEFIDNPAQSLKEEHEGNDEYLDRVNVFIHIKRLLVQQRL